MGSKLSTAIDKLLKESGFTTEIRSLNGGGIMVSLPFDLQGRKREMLIKTEEYSGMNPKQKTDTGSASVQFVSILPFAIIDGAEQATIQAVNFLNRGLPSPVFVFDEGLRKVFFKYALLTPASGVTKEVFIPLFRSLLLWIDAGSEPIERVAAGEPLLSVIQDSLTS